MKVFVDQLLKYRIPLNNVLFFAQFTDVVDIIPLKPKLKIFTAGFSFKGGGDTVLTRSFIPRPL